MKITSEHKETAAWPRLGIDMSGEYIIQWNSGGHMLRLRYGLEPQYSYDKVQYLTPGESLTLTQE